MKYALSLGLALAPRFMAAQACVTGRVVDASTDQPVKGAAISAVWAEAHSQRVHSSNATTSDSTGHYRLCLTRGVSMLLEASLGSAGAYLPIVAPASDSTLADLKLPPEDDSAHAIVAGHVVSATGAPVADATVTLLGGSLEAPTGSDGAYGIRGPSGSQVLVVRQVGLGAAIVPVTLSAQRPRLVNVTMQPAPATLPVVNVIADRKRVAIFYDSIGFTARRRVGHGHFMTADDIERKEESDTPDLLRNIPGVRVRTDHNNVQHVYTDRGPATLKSYGDCTAYVVDGQLIGNGRAVYRVDQNDVPEGPEDETAIPPPGNLIAIEVYQPGEPSPVVDGAVDRCLKVVLWTKAMLGHGS